MPPDQQQKRQPDRPHPARRVRPALPAHGHQSKADRLRPKPLWLAEHIHSPLARIKGFRSTAANLAPAQQFLSPNQSPQTAQNRSTLPITPTMPPLSKVLAVTLVTTR